MGVQVKVPTQLRSFTQGQDQVEIEGTTVAEVIAGLDSSYPGFGARVLESPGAIRRFINVYLDEEDVRFLDGLGTPTPAGSCISIIPAVAGG